MRAFRADFLAQINQVLVDSIGMRRVRCDDEPTLMFNKKVVLFEQFEKAISPNVYRLELKRWPQLRQKFPSPKMGMYSPNTLNEFKYPFFFQIPALPAHLAFVKGLRAHLRVAA